jgi:hypothetical protein
MAIIERTPPTPTYTAADAYELARRVRLDSDYDLSFTRGRADKLVLKYLEGSVESYLSPASVLSEDIYPPTKEIPLDELELSPIENADAVIYVQNRQSTEDPWSTLPGGPNAVWTWDPSSGILTVDDSYEWYRVSYWYENEVFYSDLTESIDYYARRFLSNYLEIIYGEILELKIQAKASRPTPVIKGCSANSKMKPECFKWTRVLVALAQLTYFRSLTMIINGGTNL